MRLINFIVLGLILFSCRGNDKTTRTNYVEVVEIIDGNTLKTRDKKVIQLIGVGKTKEGENYLNNNILNKQVSYKFDSQYRSLKKPLKFYLKTRNGISVNADMLKRNVSPLDKTFLRDSLRVFTNYSSGLVAVNPRPVPKAPPKAKPAKEIPQKPINSTRKKDFKEVVKATEKGVFLVYTFKGAGAQLGLGTGFFINNKGIALSNHHVFEGGKRWQIKLLSGEEFMVKSILYESKVNDFIIFQVDVGDTYIRPIPLYNQKIEKGEEVFVLGNPEGLESTLSRGVVSAIRKDFNRMDDLVQIDAAISPGSSGSPVMTMNGEALGIATLKLNDCENCNFAVNINLVKKVLKNLE